MEKLFLNIIIFCVISVASFSARADLAGATGRIANEIGTQQAMDATAVCDINLMTGSNGGNLGTPNQILCMVREMGLTGPTSAAGATRTINIGGAFDVHYILSIPGPTIDGTSYGYELKIWTCGSGCTTVNGFLPAIYTVFNVDADKTINNGLLINNFSADSGTIKGSAFIKWDVGSATTTKILL